MRFGLKRFRFIVGTWISILALLFLPGGVVAQEAQPDGPVYIVLEGDTLWDIAQRFDVPLDDLREANGLSENDTLTVGVQLVIPGLEGVRGVLVTRSIPYGENLISISRRYHIPTDAIIQLNRLTSPAELFVGADLIIPENNTSSVPARRLMLAPGQSLLELAVLAGANPWTVVMANELNGTWDGLPGDVLYVPVTDATEGPGAFPGEITSVEVEPYPLTQGDTIAIRVGAQTDFPLGGSLLGHEINFFKTEAGSYVALQGVHAMADAGFHPLVISGSLAGGRRFAFSQWVRVHAGDFTYEPSLIVKPETIDPANTKPEDQLWNNLPIEVTPERLWNEGFKYPASPIFANCYPSYFGSRRSYNEGPYRSFHTGLDICGGVGAEVYAPAPGRVVYTGTLTVRGNAIMVDHGWGIYTGYEHLSEILVKVGDTVETGQLIGRVGGSGRVTGSHLHWEVWAGGVQVDPLDWLEREYP